MEKESLRFADGTPVGRLTETTWVRNVALREMALPGAVAPATLEAEVLADNLTLEPRQSLDYCRGDTPVGRFYCLSVSCTGPGRYRIRFADSMICFERCISGWLAARTWPVKLRTLLEELCAYCDVPLAEGVTLPGEDMTVEAFSGADITGSQLLAWMGQVTGRYFTVNSQGALVPGWYDEAQTPLGGGNALVQLTDGILADRWKLPFALRTALPYQLGTLRYDLFPAAAVARVVLVTEAFPNGVSWPEGLSDRVSTLIIRDNPLTAHLSHMQLQAIASRLYTQLKDLTYTPMTCTLIPGYRVDTGARVTFAQDRYAPVTKVKIRSGRCTLTAAGEAATKYTDLHRVSELENLLDRLQNAQWTNQGIRVRLTTGQEV